MSVFDIHELRDEQESRRYTTVQGILVHPRIDLEYDRSPRNQL